MATVLVYTSPACGHLYPIIPTLEALRDRGHRICIRTLKSEVPLCQRLGLEAVALSSEVEGVIMDDHLGTSSADRIRRAYSAFTRRAKHEIADLQAALEDISPDFLLIDINALGAQIVAERNQIPWASYSPFLLPIPGSGIPPFGPGLVPMRGPLGRLRDRIVGKVINELLNRAGLGPYNQLREQAGLQAVSSIAAHPYEASPLLLAYSSAALDYNRSYPANVLTVGPSGWGPASDGSEEQGSSPAILVTTSTEYQGDEILVHTAVAALADGEEELIITVPAMNPADFKQKDGVVIAKRCDYSHLMPRTRVMVTHGGMGSTQKALMAGIPVVIVPFGRDQLEVARRVEYAGVGVCVPPKKLNAQRLREAVAQARQLRHKTEHLAEALRQSPGAGAAADAIEKHLAEEHMQAA